MAAYPKKPRIVNLPYQAWIRSHQCVVSNSECWGLTEACHVKSRGAFGDDPNNLYPGCRKHHAEQHNIGIRSFGQKYGFVLSKVAQGLWIAYQQEGK